MRHSIKFYEWETKSSRTFSVGVLMSLSNSYCLTNHISWLHSTVNYIYLSPRRETTFIINHTELQCFTTSHQNDFLRYDLAFFSNAKNFLVYL